MSNTLVLDGHDVTSVNKILGRVIDHRVEGGQLLAAIRFVKRAAAVETMQDVADVVLTQVSVGYQVGEYEIAIDGEGPRWRAPYPSQGGSVSALAMIR